MVVRVEFKAATVRHIAGRVKAFGILYGVTPRVLVRGWLPCASGGDLAHLRDYRPVTKLGRSVAVVDLGVEGLHRFSVEQVAGDPTSGVKWAVEAEVAQ